MSATQKLATWAHDQSILPDEVKGIAIYHFFDGLGDALGALHSNTSIPALQVALAGAQISGESSILGHDQRTSAPMAALALGAMIHHLDYDDTHAGGLVHATSVSLPAALAVGEREGATWEEILTAATVGLESVSRIAMATPHGFHARGIHATHACGTISASLVAAKLMRLTHAQTVAAMGVAASASGGLLEFLNTGSSTKQLHPGTASMNGVLAALLAKEGASGPESALEGKYGLFAVLSDRPANPAIVTQGLGEIWEATQITIKPYAACQLSHASLDALRQAISTISDFAPARVKTVTVRVHPDSAGIVAFPESEKYEPRSPYDAKFSLQWSLAALTLDGDLPVTSYSSDSIARPAVVEFARRIKIELTQGAGVAADAAGYAEIELFSGERVIGEVECSAGGPRNRLTREDLVSKFAKNAICSQQDAEDFLAVMEDVSTELAEVLTRFGELSKGN